jgi:hypothetical protein
MSLPRICGGRILKKSSSREPEGYDAQVEGDKVAGIQVVVDLERTGNEEGEVLGVLEALDGPEVQEVQEVQEDDDLFVDEIVAAVQTEEEAEEAVRELDVEVVVLELGAEVVVLELDAEDAIVELVVEVHEMEEAAVAAAVVAVEDVYLELLALTYL